MLKKSFYIGTFLALFTPYANADVNVAVVAPQSGSRAVFGQELWEGARIAVDEINSNGGLLGEKINLIMVDDRCDDRFAISTSQMIALYNSQKGKTSLVVGPYCSNSFSHVANTYAKANIFQIIPTPLSAAEAKEEHRGLIKMTGYHEQQSDTFYNYSQENFPNKKIGLVIDSRLSGAASVGEGVKKLFAADKRDAYLSVFDFADYDKDIDNLVEQMEEAHIQLAYILGDDDNIAKLVKEWKDVNPQSMFP